MEVSPHFLQGVDVYVLCVCVYAHTHTLHVGYSAVSPGVGTRHLESPEEIQCTVVIVYIYTVRCTNLYLYAGLQVEVCTNCLFVFFYDVFSFTKKKRRRCEQTTDAS